MAMTEKEFLEALGGITPEEAGALGEANDKRRALRKEENEKHLADMTDEEKQKAYDAIVQAAIDAGNL